MVWRLPDLKADIRLLQQYAKAHHAGAFFVPLPRELEAADAEGRIHRWSTEVGGRVVAVSECSIKPLRRHDFTGLLYHIPAGASVLTHLAVESDAPLPDLRRYDFVYAYAEDWAVSRQLRAQGFRVHAVAITASSSTLVVYSRRASDHVYPAYDQATLTELPLAVAPEVKTQALAEVGQIEGWRDDYPYYHRGEWSQASLRGYRADDPFWGVKPKEMSRRWKQEHPDWAALTNCEWTVLAARLPAVMAVIRSVPWWREFERVRLLRLTQGQLTRHTDITDRDAGTRDGQISRFHIPMVTHEDVRMQAWDLDGRQHVTHWQPWHLYYLDQRKPHAAVNPTPVARIHLVVDVVTDEAVRQAIADSFVAR